MNRLDCPNCGHRLKYAAEHAGRKVKCAKCAHSFRLPDSGGHEFSLGAGCGDTTRQSGGVALATTRPQAATEPAAVTEDRQHRLPHGDKHQCPKCGGADVRAMSAAETKDFYGGNPFVLSPPRHCRACGHGWEARPTRSGCYVMIVLSVSVVGPLGAGSLLVGAAGTVLTLLAGNFLAAIGGVALALSGIGMLYAAVRSVKKYRGYLRQSS